MLNYSIKVRSGTQIRTDPITGTEARVNPGRALRPIASSQAPTSPTSTTTDASLVEIEMDHIAVSAHNLDTIRALLTTGLTKHQLLTLFPHYATNDAANNGQPQPLFQLFSKESPFKGTTLPEPLQALIQSSFATNPFSPVDLFVRNVVPLEPALLTALRDKSTALTTFTTPTDLLTFQPTSSVYNYHLYTALVDSAKVVGKSDDGTAATPPAVQCADEPRFTLAPVHVVSVINPETNHIDGLVYHPVAISPDGPEIDVEFVKSTLLSPSGQIWGTFVPQQPQPQQQRQLTDPTPIVFPTPLTSSSFTHFGIPSLGEATLFYNKFPFAQFHSVITLTEAPFVHLRDFTPTKLNSILALISSFFAAVEVNYSTTILDHDVDYGIQVSPRDVHPTTDSREEAYHSIAIQTQPLSTTLSSHPHPAPLFPTIVWNYLPSSAGSLIHPHWQCYIEDGANKQLENVLRLSHQFRQDQYRTQTKASIDTINYSSRFNLTKAVLAYEYQLYQNQVRSSHDNIDKSGGDNNNNNNNNKNNTSPVLDLTQPHSFIQQSRHIARIPIACECQSCKGLSVHLVAPFAPTMSNEVQVYVANLRDDESGHHCQELALTALNSTPITAITPSQRGHIASLIELTCPAMIHALSRAFYLVLQLYNKLKIMALNMATLGAPTSNSRPVCDLHNDMIQSTPLPSSSSQLIDSVDMNDVVLSFTFVSRPLPSGLYTNDTGPLERLLGSNVIATPPEIYAMNYRTLIIEHRLNE